jgi:hypothetical protein
VDRVDEGCSNLLGVLVGTLGVLSDGLELSALLLASLLELLGDGITLLSLLPEKDTRDLRCANAEEKEVDGSKATIDTVSTLTTQRSKNKSSGHTKGFWA